VTVDQCFSSVEKKFICRFLEMDNEVRKIVIVLFLKIWVHAYPNNDVIRIMYERCCHVNFVKNFCVYRSFGESMKAQ
jgi:hypothetical protein